MFLAAPAPFCVMLRTVSGTLNFITFGKIPLFAFALSCKKEGRRKEFITVRMLLGRKPNGERNRRRISK